MRFGEIHLSCGHEDQDHPNGWSMVTKDIGDRGQDTVLYQQVCSKCFAWWLTEIPYMLCSTEQQQKDYLNE